MARFILSAADARSAAHEPHQYLLWVKQPEAPSFTEPGWVKLEPPRDGAVLFIHRDREMHALRIKGVI
jgi:hypothetical protein